MFTSIDKLLVALIGALAGLVTYFWGYDLSYLTEERILMLIPFATAFFVWLIPNKEDQPAQGHATLVHKD